MRDDESRAALDRDLREALDIETLEQAGFDIETNFNREPRDAE